MGAVKPTEGGAQGTAAPVTLARGDSGPKGVVTRGGEMWSSPDAILKVGPTACNGLNMG